MKKPSSTHLRVCILIVLLVILVGFTGSSVNAERVCNPFTREPDPGMLPLGTRVEFKFHTAKSFLMLIGYVDEYYIQSCFPGGGSIIGLDPTAYVIEYRSFDGSRTIKNRDQLTVVDSETGE